MDFLLLLKIYNKLFTITIFNIYLYDNKCPDMDNYYEKGHLF